jgi:hypothetical protein
LRTSLIAWATFSVFLFAEVVSYTTSIFKRFSSGLSGIDGSFEFFEGVA